MKKNQKWLSTKLFFGITLVSLTFVTSFAKATNPYAIRGLVHILITRVPLNHFAGQNILKGLGVRIYEGTSEKDWIKELSVLLENPNSFYHLQNFLIQWKNVPQNERGEGFVKKYFSLSNVPSSGSSPSPSPSIRRRYMEFIGERTSNESSPSIPPSSFSKGKKKPSTPSVHTEMMVKDIAEAIEKGNLTSLNELIERIKYSDRNIAHILNTPMTDNNTLFGFTLGKVFHPFPQQGEHKVTPDILEARRAPYIKLAVQMIEKGANVNTANKTGGFPLHKVAWLNHEEYALLLASLLLKKGADINALDKSQRIPLHYAVARGNIKLAQMLLENNSHVNARDIDGQTPLHWAPKNVSEGRGVELELVYLLIKNGADVTIRDNRGHSFLDIGEITDY